MFRPLVRADFLLLAGALLLSAPAFAQSPWPAEPLASAVNLTGIEGPGVNDFHVDLSGACWNPVTRTLWVCRNGPGGSASKIWAVVEDGAGGWAIDSLGGARGEWTGFGDLEGLTQADFGEPVVYTIIEGEERIKEYDLSVYGTAVLANDWDTSPHLPYSGGSGAEGITFVPDSFLAAAGFVDGSGAPRTSAGGMEGLMFVAHQNGGAIYVFDLDRESGGFDFVGEYATGYTETAALEFDRSTGELYAWHDAGYDVLSVFDLTSAKSAGRDTREFHALRRFQGPSHGNNEGIALVSAGDCFCGERSFFLTVDGGGYESLLLFREFSDGCPIATAVREAGASGASSPRLSVRPHPFTHEASLSFSLPAPADLRLGVYDLSGREIRSFRLPGRPAGPGFLIWDGRDRRGAPVGSGVYFIRLEADGRFLAGAKATVVR